MYCYYCNCRYNDGRTQTSGILSQLAAYTANPLNVVKHSSTAIQVNFVPNVVQNSQNGLATNGYQIGFNNCDTNTNR